jgi:hypothetical protein
MKNRVKVLPISSRRIIYKRMLKQMEKAEAYDGKLTPPPVHSIYKISLCANLLAAMQKPEYASFLSYSLNSSAVIYHFFPEILRHRPKHFTDDDDNRGTMFWFPGNVDGVNKRIEIIKDAIFRTTPFKTENT